MPFTRVVILGGGPIGLLCAIEAKKYFRNVFIVEKRTGYSRVNVPALNTPLIKHLKEIGVDKELWPTGAAGSESLSFQRLEEALWKKAKADGVLMQRGYVVSALTGIQPMLNGLYQEIHLELSEWDEEKKAIKDKDAPKILRVADLLVIASGGGAANDEKLDKLGFSFTKLKAKNYAAYGIFTPPITPAIWDGKLPDLPPETPEEKEEASRRAAEGHQKKYAEQKMFMGLFEQVIGDKIAFKTPDHNYLLIQLSKCTKSDFKYLQTNSKDLHTLLTTVSAGYKSDMLDKIKGGKKSAAVFEVKIQRARHLRSEEYPAVIVGDAAVTPHPRAGTGLETGFIGVQQVSSLFQALQNADPSADNSEAWKNFNQAYDRHVSKKALEGTDIILSNIISLLGQFIEDGKKSNPGSSAAFKDFFARIICTADVLKDVLELQKAKAKRLSSILKNSPTQFKWSEAEQLWAEIGDTYKAVKKLTADVGLFQGRVDELEKALRKRKTES